MSNLIERIVGRFTAQSTRSFPLDCETLDYLQNQAHLAAMLGNMGGNYIILSGCQPTGGGLIAARGSGYVFVRTEDYPQGEILYFGGGVGDYARLQTEAIDVTAGGSTYSTAYMRRRLVATGSEANSLFAWNNCLRTDEHNLHSIKNTLQQHANRMDTIEATFAAVPVGVVYPFAGNTLPNGYLLCNGQQVLIDDYSELYAVIGNTYNTANPDAGKFFLPNLCGRNIFGATGDANDTAMGEVGKSGGSRDITLTVQELPQHQHLYSADSNLATSQHRSYPIPINQQLQNAGVVEGGSDYWWAAGEGDYAVPNNGNEQVTSGSGTGHGRAFLTGKSGFGQAFSSLNPFLTMNYIIKAV